MKRRRLKKWKAYFRQATAQIESYLCILAPLTIVLGSTGLLLENGPILQSLSIITGPVFICALIGLLLESLITVFLESRSLVKRYWRKNTPPYRTSEVSDLPVVDESIRHSIDRTKKYMLYVAIIYLMSIITSIYIAVSRPSEIALVANSPLLDVAIAIIAALLQIPSSLLDISFFNQFIPQPNTAFDATVVFFLIVLPTPFMILLMSNLRFIIERKHNRIYWTVADQVHDNITSESPLLSSVKVEHGVILILDILVTLFMFSFVAVNLN